MRYHGPLYRALNPLYARDPLSGKGAARYGGRFNPRGVPALYGSLTIMTALREANQAGSLQPITLVSYEAEIDQVFDARDASALASTDMDALSLSDNRWRDQMTLAGEARTQTFSRTLIASGYNGLLVKSYARGAAADDLNLVLWSWGSSTPARLTLIDDENRLSR